MSIKIKLKKNDKIRQVLRPSIAVAAVLLKVDFESEAGFFKNVGITGSEIVTDFPSLAANADGLVDPHKPFIIKHIPSFWGIEEVGPNSFGKFQNFQKGDFINDTAIEFMEVMQFNKAVIGFKR